MKKNKKLMENTIMLYILTFSNYFFNFITIPYQTRILGPEIYGKIGFALAFATYFKLFFDFGFILSATESISKNRENKKYVSKILTSVNILKFVFVAISSIILCILLNSVTIFKQDKMLFFLFYLYVAIDCFQPDFLYRGMENMKVITIRNVIVKSFFTVMIFLVLKSANQYLYVPILNILGSLISLIFVYYDVFTNMKIKLVKVDFKDLKENFNQSKIYFFSRIASTVYSATNTFILGFVYPSSNILGYYSSSDKILTAARSAVTPISDSVYPYMVKNKDFKLIKKLLKIFMPIIGCGCLILFIFAEPICVLLFGKQYASASIVLRFMIPIIFITLPSYLLGFPTMSPLGLKNEANLSVIVAASIHLVIIGILYIYKILNIYSICILTIFTEFIVLGLRIYFILRKRSVKNEK